jgi:hypothetical protein
MSKLHYPAEKSLQTGDLLFPKVVPSSPSPVWLSLRRRLERSDPGNGKTLRAYLSDAIGPDAVQVLKNDAFTMDVSALLAPPRVRSTSASALGAEMSKIASQLSSGAFDPGQGLSMLGGELMRLAAKESDPRAEADRTYLMLVILWKAFPELLDDWLDKSVVEFLGHPLYKLLIGAIENESGPGLFVGHVAMVLCERDGAHAANGRVWVIEANTTDFSHYRVAVHPYLVPGEPEAVPAPGDVVFPRLRGWANRRLSLGESIWHSRHKSLLAGDADAGALDMRQRLVDVAKSYLGRPYGFFDHPDFGDDGRFYCGEFVHKVFQRVGGELLKVDENRTWNWLYENRALMGDATFVQRLEHAMKAGGLLQQMQGKAFFLLALPMLYKSAALLPQQDPKDTPPYV